MLDKKKVLAFAVIYIVLLALAFAAVIGPKQLAGFLTFKGEEYECKNCNVILISIDTLRADHLGVYGYYRNTSPNIDEFAKDAIVFENAFAQAPWTLPSHASMFSGVYPSKTGLLEYLTLPVDNRTGIRPVSDKLTMLAESFNQSNYTTIALTDDGYVASRYGFGQGFNEYHEINTLNESNYHLLEQNITRLSKERPFFLFLHTYNVHIPYDPPPPYNKLFYQNYYGNASGDKDYLKKLKQTDPKDISREDINYLISLYDGEIRFTDYEIGRLLKLLRALNLTDNTIVIITSDHGESFFENFEGHSSTQFFQKTKIRLLHEAFYEPVMKVPLIIRLPNKSAGEKIAKEVRLMDITPTILQITGLNNTSVNQSFDGEDLFDNKLSGEQILIYENTQPQDVDKKLTNFWIAIKEDGYKYAQNENMIELLFDTIKDPNETVDLSTSYEYEEIVGYFRQKMENYRKNMSSFSDVPAKNKPNKAKDKKVEQKLKSLGYMT